MARKKRGVIALITDFGQTDPFVGVMKGVILRIHPECSIVDITHGVAPQDVREAAYVLRSARPYFPKGTVFLCVVDPGVGTSRRGIVAKGAGDIFVAPDNGLLTLAEPLNQIAQIKNSDLFLEPVSRTFHGRDVFAPVAAHLSKGMALSRIGPAVGRIKRLSLPGPIRKGKEVRGEVVRIDRFGNLTTNLKSTDLPQRAGLGVRVGRRRVGGLRRAYEEASPGEALAIIGSDGFLEVAVRGGSAKKTLRARVGTRVAAVVQ